MNQNKKLRLDMAVYFLFALFVFWMAAQIPYTHDDWEWGIGVGMRHLLTADINSRYAGNFFMVVMSRSEVLKTVIMGTFFFLLPWQLASLAAGRGEGRTEKRVFYFLIAIGLLFTISREVWQQTCGWIAGFANYVISASFLLLSAGEWVQALENGDREEPSVFRSAFFFVTSVVGQMFLENLALFLFAASVSVCIVYRKKYGRTSRHLVWMAVGMAVGLVLMFSSPIYTSLLQTGFAVGHIRRMSVSSSAGLWGSIYNILFQCAVLAIRCGEMNVVCSCLALVLLGIAACRRCSGKVRLGICGANLAFLLYFVASKVMNVQYSAVSTLRVLFAAFLNAMYLLAVMVEVWLIFKDNKALMFKLLAFWTGGIAILMPLIATSENGHRVFFTYLVCIMLFNLTLVDVLLKDIGRRKTAPWIAACALCVAVLMVHYGTIYGAIGSCKRERDAIYAEQVENPADTVVLPQFPYESHMWNPDPIADIWEGYYREFYGIDEDVEIIVDIRYP